MTNHDGSTHQGDHNAVDDSPEAIAEQFLARMKDDLRDPSDTEHEEDLETPEDEAEAEDEDAHDGEPSEDEAEGEDEGTGESDASKDAKAPNKKRAAADEDEVEVTVDGTAKKFTVSQLKRLAGQEEALTRRSQEASELRRKSEEAAERYDASLQRHYNKAVEDYRSKYDGINLHAEAMRNGWTAEQYEEVCAQEAAAYRTVQYFHEELASHTATQKRRRDEEAQANVRANVAELADPVKGIKDWGNDKLRSIIEYATGDLGLDREYVSGLGSRVGDAKLVKVIDRLMTLERSQKALTTKTKAPAKAAPSKVLKSPSEATRTAGRPDAEAKARAAFKRSGSIDDMVSLVMSRSKR